MKRGCFFGLFALFALAVTYDLVLEHFLDSPHHIFASFFGALFGLMMISAVIERWRGWRDLRLIRAAESHGPLIDGQMTAIVGPINPLAFPLRAPVSDKPCVAYEYEVNTDSRRSRHAGHGHHRTGIRIGRRRATQTTMHVGEKHANRQMSGIALTPSAIASPTHGAIRLLAFPLLEGFPPERYSDPASRGRFRTFVESSTFQTRGMLSAIGAFAGALTDDDGAVRVDYDLNGKKEIPEGAWFSERVIPPGTMVCALGRYTADRRALKAEGMSFVRLLAGDGESARKSIAAKSRSQFIVAVIFFIFSHGFLAGASYLSSTRYARVSPNEQVRVLTNAIGNHDVAALELAVKRGADPNVMNSAGEVPVQIAADPDIARALVRLGANVNATGGSGRTPLMFAVMRHRLDMARAWLNAGADVRIARADGATALTDAEESGEDEDIAVMLREAGATCDHVGEANGTALPSDGGLPFAAVRSYIEAIHRRDLPRLRALSHGRSPGFYEGVDFAVWQQSRPAAPRLLGGYATSSAATLTLGPDAALGTTISWSYQLVRTDAGWQIAREWARPVDEREPRLEHVPTESATPATPSTPSTPPTPAGPDAPVERARPSRVPDPVERPRPARPPV